MNTWNNGKIETSILQMCKITCKVQLPNIKQQKLHNNKRFFKIPLNDMIVITTYFDTKRCS